MAQRCRSDARRRPFDWCALSLAVLMPALLLAEPPTPPPRLRVVLVVFDGLRPDQITPSRMPSLSRLAASGVRSERHHAVFPTVTRVNASALATGAHPAGHGILDNTVFLPAVDSTRGLNTADATEMQRANAALGGRLLTAPTLRQRLAARGMRLLVASAGSSGSAYLFAGGDSAYIVHPELTSPEALAGPANRLLGAAPPDRAPNVERNERAVDAVLRLAVDSLDVDVAYLWLSDPDHTTHEAGLGSALSDSAIRAADRAFGRLLEGLDARGLSKRVDVLVVSDHGFSTHSGGAGGLRALFAPFRGDVVVAGTAVHVRKGGAATRAAVVTALQRSPLVGAIFTAPSDAQHPDSAAVPGTLSYAAIGWQHPRSADVLFSADWSHATNAEGVAGVTRQAGVAGHGTSSPYDVRASLVAAGPHFRVDAVAALPSSNADIVPTILHLLGLPATPAGVTGRPLLELLRRSGSRLPTVRSDSVVASVSGYRTVAYRTHVGAVCYLDSTRTQRP